MLEILFQYGSVTIKTFNILLALAFVFTGAFVIRYISRQKMDLSFLSRYFLYAFLGMIIGGRIFYVIEHWAVYRIHVTHILFIWDLNFSFFGVLYGLVIALFIIARQTKEDLWSWFDTSVLATLLAMTFIHIGHFFNGTQYGSPTNLPWGISFDTQNIPFINPIHPTQIYAAILALIIFLYALKKSRRIHLSGVAGNLALMLYSLGMFGIDFLHGAPSLYVKISFGFIAALSFIFLVHCSHKTHHLPSED
ncbi:prolipoprotein diacylglyceryl transferase [Patescibacteria group bacterium]|nr:prolipoprotein diacylglyceryl transferase [Patescibacteria group bacterium]MBU1683480.1 prolipoprotein diacylglyceryl transferase [Patescibacteria group bacterium]MBU1934764.1 prolipoprotein diacylglyceryl transferase [Patescibacteria group bacterium]